MEQPPLPSPSPFAGPPLADAGDLPTPALLTAVLTQMADGVVVADASGRVVYVNAAAGRLYGLVPAAAVGTSVRDWPAPAEKLTLAGAPYPPAQRPLVRALNGELVQDDQWMLRRPDGTTLIAQGTASPIQDTAGQVRGAVLTLRDATMEVTARREVESASRAKSQFLATTSHELRTPLNAILGYTELLELGVSGPLTAQQRTQLERVRLAARHLLGIVNQVLDLSKLESERLVIRVRPAWVEESIHAAVALVEPLAQEHALTLLSACAPDGEVAYLGDPDRVTQVLVNLLANAIKFTPAGGRITVTCGHRPCPPADAELDLPVTRAADRVADQASAGDKSPPTLARDGAATAAAAWQPDTLRPTGPVAGAHAATEPTAADPCARGWAFVRVEDTGVGIGADHLTAVFEPFVQVEQAQGSVYTRVQGGTGLGLTIARRLARLMGGDVTVQSTPGEGSAFFLWLPSARADDLLPPRHLRPERRSAARHARGLTTVARAAQSQIEQVLARYTHRLRSDPATPSARTLNAIELEDHLATYLADVAQTLAVIESAEGTPSDTLRDGTVIQRVIAERHGAQRGRRGWAADEVRREFSVLAEELRTAIRERLHGGAPQASDTADETMGAAAPVAEAFQLLSHFLAHAERSALRALERQQVLSGRSQTRPRPEPVATDDQ